MYWRHSIMVLSLLRNSRATYSPIHTQHRRNLISEEDAAIFEGLESLDVSLDWATSMSCPRDPAHQCSPKILCRGQRCQSLPHSIDTNSSQFVSTFKVGDRENPPSPEGIEERLLIPWNSSQANPNPVPRNMVGTSTDLYPDFCLFEDKGASLVHPTRNTQVNMLAPHAGPPHTSQNRSNGSQRVILEHSLSSSCQSPRPTTDKKKRKRNKFLHSERDVKDLSSGQTSHFSTAENQINSTYQEKVYPEFDGVNKNTVLQKNYFHTAAKADIGLSYPSRKFSESIKVYNQEKERLHAGLDSDNPKIRVSALVAYLCEQLPNFSFTEIKSLKEFFDNLTNGVWDQSWFRAQFCWLWVTGKRKECNKVELLDFLKSYKEKHRPLYLQPGPTFQLYTLNNIAFEISVQAGIRRTRQLGIEVEITSFFKELARVLRSRIYRSEIKEKGKTRAVNGFIENSRAATIVLLYQVDLLHRLSRSMDQNIRQSTIDLVNTVFGKVKDFWSVFEPFGLSSDLESRLSLTNCFIHPRFIDAMENKNQRSGSYPIGMKFSKLLLSRWCLHADYDFFRHLMYGDHLLASGFFKLLEDFAIAELFNTII